MQITQKREKKGEANLIQNGIAAFSPKIPFVKQANLGSGQSPPPVGPSMNRHYFFSFLNNWKVHCSSNILDCVEKNPLSFENFEIGFCEETHTRLPAM